MPHTGIGIEAIEKELILRALRKFEWNQTQTARFLDLSRKTLIRRMEKLGLRKDQPAGSPSASTPHRE
ncbi:MAG: helix-turn-helix domain-containing protein [Bryobacteraceae bacterium]|nr:helix-turn-helix domain-containing protein [Bryobacteraceae bacterium]